MDRATHRGRPWRVHTLAADFALLDLWDVPLRRESGRSRGFLEFHRLFMRYGLPTRARPPYPLMPASAGDLVQLARLAGLGVLFGLRRLLGVALRLDGGSQSDLPVPGCAERSLVARLTAEDRARNRLDPTAGPVAGFRAVYVFEDEALHEVSNRTIHALLHLSWCDGEPSGVVLAVYVKSRGLLSDAYLALIGPFRHLIVYPAWIRHLQRVWEVCR